MAGFGVCPPSNRVLGCYKRPVALDGSGASDWLHVRANRGEFDRIRRQSSCCAPACDDRLVTSVPPTIGVEFTPDMPTVFERFDVVYAE